MSVSARTTFSLVSRLSPRCRQIARQRLAPANSCIKSSTHLAFTNLRSTPNFLSVRTRGFHDSASSKTKALQNENPPSNDSDIFYRGPLSATFRNLKLFSLTSLSLASALTPFIFIINAPLSLSARIALAAAALGTSASSTALIAWCGKPYVISMKRETGSNAIELTTTDIFLRERRTTVPDPRFFQPTSRPFATWEIPKSFTADLEPNTQRSASSVEPIAVTRDGSGKVVGQCTVKWNEQDGQLAGTMREQGYTIRHFNIHEELLKDPL